mmetsp:Transcript_62631/g.201989  ORF Transcript_62631/g.201989 Transcript_62631/m.201989 type:complete len:128 (+) Transcript_62631:454-837(+)
MGKPQQQSRLWWAQTWPSRLHHELHGGTDGHTTEAKAAHFGRGNGRLKREVRHKGRHATQLRASCKSREAFRMLFHASALDSSCALRGRCPADTADIQAAPCCQGHPNVEALRAAVQGWKELAHGIP